MEVLARVTILLLCSMMTVSQTPYVNITASECDAEHEHNRVQFINASRCRTPRYVLIDVPTPAIEIRARPQAVFVQRCVGVCPSTRHRCLPKEVQLLDIHVRYTHVKTKNEWCAVVSIWTHSKCSCNSTSWNFDYL